MEASILKLRDERGSTAANKIWIYIRKAQS